MFKLVVALALVAACSATYDVGLGVSGSYYVDVGYKHIKIANYQGDYVNFVVDNFYGFDGPQNVLVQFYGQGVAPKTVQYLDQQTPYSQRTQSDVLYQIFTDYDGTLDEVEYEKLISIISTYVQNGQIHPAVLYALQALNGQYEVLSYFDQYQGMYHQTPYHSGLGMLFGKGYGYGYNQKYGMSYYPGLYSQAYSGSYSPYSYLRGQYGYGYPQKFYGGIYGSQYGKGWSGSYYPQSFGGYYPYASRYYQTGSYYPGQSYVGSYGPYAGTYQFPRQYAF